LVAVARVLDDELVFGAGSLASISENGEMAAEACSGAAAQ
jgi:hypothetical protein